MNRTERLPAIRSLEEARGSRVISYFMSDRETFPPGVPGFMANLAGEPQLRLIDLLREMGHVPKLDLFLHTRGGATEAVWPLVSVLREYCDHFAVVVPFRAHSAGTMICLGADEIVMTPFAELSPIDPTTGNQFNPRDPTNPGNQFGISVEDVVAYFALAEERAKLELPDQRTEVFRQLTQNVHPLALGNVQRVHLLIQRLARELLSFHMSAQEDGPKITEIINGLTTRFYSHVHAIPRREARELMGDWVRSPSDAEESAILALFDLYADQFELRNKFNLPAEIGDTPMLERNQVSAVLETTDLCFECQTELIVTQRPGSPGLPPGFQPGQPLQLAPGSSRSYDFSIQKSGWVEVQAEVTEEGTNG
jgi:hypothetical protein